VAALNNPAGRLHELLAEFRLESAAHLSAVDVWSQVLATDNRSSTLLAIAEVAGLVPEIEAAVIRSGDAGQLRAFRRFSGKWLTAIFQPEQNLYAKGSGGTSIAADEDALSVLELMSSTLAITGSEGKVPSAEVIADLRQQVQALIDGIVNDPELPGEIKRLALDHAHRLAHALEHFRIGGPGAVKAATERLVGATVLAPERVRKSQAWKHLLAVGGAVWTVFIVTGEAQQALESWETLIKALPGGKS
jgi:hypothetical protein